MTYAPNPRDDAFFSKRPSEVLSLCKKLVPLMNAVHGVEFSEKFWIRLLIPYVWAFYNQHDHYRGSKNRYPVPLKPISGWTPPDTIAIIKDWALTILRSFRSKSTLMALNRALLQNNTIILGARGNAIAESIDAPFIDFNWITILRFPRKAPRQRLMELCRNTDLNQFLCTQMPRIYLEYLGYLLEFLMKLEPPTVREVYVEHYSSFFDKLLSCYLGERGAYINQIQMGGFVGEMIESADDVKRYERDRFLTYGWKIFPEDTPFYAVRLEEFAKRYKKYERSKANFDILIVFNQVNSHPIKTYYQQCVSIFRADLDHGAYPLVKLRPRGSTRWLSAKKSLRFLGNVGAYEIDSGKMDMAKACSGAKLVIHLTHPSTNFLECVFVDHPVMAIQTNESLTELVRPYYDFFIETKVFHKDASSLVAHLNSIEIDAWWSGVIKREEYKEFKRTFARSKAQYFSELNWQGCL